MNPSNESWVGPSFSEQSLQMVVLRAVEQRRYLVRSTTSGISAIVDPWGRVLARSGIDTREVLRGEVRAREGRSGYGRVGDAFALLCALAVVARLGWPRRAVARGGVDR